MTNILVTGVGSNIGQGIVKSLKMADIQCRIIGTDMVPLSAGLFRCDKGYTVPAADDEDFTDEIIRICERERVNIVLIGADPEVPVFALNRSVIEDQCEAMVIVSNHQLVDLTFDKWHTYTLLRKRRLNYARSALGNSEEEIEGLVAECGYPLVVKPRRKGGSKNVFTVNGADELAYALKIAEDAIVQEYLGSEDQEYTSGVFFSKNSEVRGIITMKRELLCGTTYRAIVDHYPEVHEEVEKVAGILGGLGAIGSINVQMRLAERGAVTLEVNPRFSGTTVFRAKMGFNEPEATIRHFLFGEEIGQLRYRKGVVMRYWEEVYTSIEEFEKLKKEKQIENSKSEVQNLL
jgi:carbamoyl-phosphate synthase large subunit